MKFLSTSREVTRLGCCIARAVTLLHTLAWCEHKFVYASQLKRPPKSSSINLFMCHVKQGIRVQSREEGAIMRVYIYIYIM